MRTLQVAAEARQHGERYYFRPVEKILFKRPLATEGIPPLIEDPQEALSVFEEILKRGAIFYPNAEEATKGPPRVCRVIALAES